MEFPVSKIFSKNIRHIVDLAILIDFWAIIGAILKLFLEQFLGNFSDNFYQEQFSGPLFRAILGGGFGDNFF